MQARPLSLNVMARNITLGEGQKQSISIAQVKEVIRLVLQELNFHSDGTILATIRRPQRKIKRKVKV